MRERIYGCIEELRSYKLHERLFCLFSMLVCFSIALEYSITRPASHSLFLTTFTSKAIPYLWLSVVPINFLLITLYNHFLPKIGPLRMWLAVSSSVLTINFLAAILLKSYPKYIFIQCIWKDIYILLMFKQLWSMIHCTIQSGRAKYLYGVIFASGTLGSCIGSLVPSLLAIPMGSENLFYLTLPIYLFMFFCYFKAHSKSNVSKKDWDGLKSKDSSSRFKSLQSVLKNRYLLAILLLVVFMQISSGFMEYRFNIHLEETILDRDLRTATYGKLFGLMNTCSLALQAIGTFFLIHLIGLKRVHFFIPLVLLGSSLTSWVFPSFMLTSFSFVFLKSIDFSLFSVGREMLYIPFGLDEKYRGKAIIDVFAYRSAKALVSLSILCLQALFTGSIINLVTFLSFSVFLFWMAVVAIYVRKDPQAISA